MILNAFQGTNLKDWKICMEILKWGFLVSTSYFAIQFSKWSSEKFKHLVFHSPFSQNFTFLHSQKFFFSKLKFFSHQKLKENFSELKSFLFFTKYFCSLYFLLLFKNLPSTCSVCNWRKFIEWHSIYIGGEISSFRIRCIFLSATCWRLKIVGFWSMRKAFWK